MFVFQKDTAHVHDQETESLARTLPVVYVSTQLSSAVRLEQGSEMKRKMGEKTETGLSLRPPFFFSGVTRTSTKTV